ncbi:MAG: hypothetical protein HYU41_07895 [Candidatus Rokubacteria bacterium]|nr:hypothetical protein [Candidatus Rokubacteria bacterium]
MNVETLALRSAAKTDDAPTTGRPVARRPGLDVRLAVRPVGGATAVTVKVGGARGPFRVYVYVDGDLTEAWIPAKETNELLSRVLRHGRHTVTARAIDALGRWGGASTMTVG